MSEDSQSNFMPSTASAFEAFKGRAKIGQTIYFRSGSSKDSPERSGILIEVFSDGMIIDTDDGEEWVPAQDVQTWRVPKPPPESPELPPLSTSIVQDEQQGPLLSDNLPNPADLELLFAGDPVLLLPEPSFNFPSSQKEIQQIILRWKNMYDYAKKIREPARMSQEVPRIEELADTLQDSSLYYLAGLLADSSGLGNWCARAYFQNALELDQNHQGAATAIAALAIRQNDLVSATKFLLWAVRLEGNLDKTNLIRCIGQCILRMDKENIPEIGQLLSLELPEQARRLASSLIALVVNEDHAAYKAALSANIDELRRTKIGNDLFTWNDTIVPPVEPKISPHSPITIVSNRDITRRGRVSAYYPGRNFGFIVDDSTGQTWFFHKTAIVNPSLLNALTDGRVRQDVMFSGSAETQSGRYPIANDIISLSGEAEIHSEVPKRAPLRLRLQAIPKDGSAFARAMEAEQLDQLDKAEILYREEIANRGRHTKSAIKNLAALQNRRGKPDNAIKLLDSHQSFFEETEAASLDQMRVQFLVKARKYTDAAQLLARLAKNPLNKKKKLEYLRQEAYCVLVSGNIDLSIRKIESILKENPGDTASQLLLAKAQEAKNTGFLPEKVVAGMDDDEEDELFSSLALGLSQIARRQIDNCELRGLDARTKESREFSERDFKALERLLDNLRGRRPRERADYLLTLATLCELSPDIAGKRSLHQLLRRHFVALAEASMVDDEPIDVVRCYVVESLNLCPVKMKDNDTAREAAWVLLLGTYLSDKPEPSSLLQHESGRRLENVLRLLSRNPNDWQRVAHDAVFYQLRAPSAFNYLSTSIKVVSELAPIQIDEKAEQERMKELERAFKIVPLEAISGDRLRQAKEAIAQQIPGLLFDLDRRRLSEFVKILGDAAEYALERHFRERETRYLRLEGDILRIIEEISRHPTHLSIERLLPAISSLLELLRNDFARIEAQRPDLELTNVLNNDFYVLHDKSVALRLLLSSKDESAPPIEAIGLVLEHGDAEPCHSPDPLHGGQTREIELSVRPTTKQIHDETFTVEVRVEYRTRNGATERSQPFALPVRLGNPAFDEIPNPYGRYSGGSPVEDEEMFFGRAALIDRIVTCLSTGTMGQCFVLYGQKRSGKSSVLKQVEKRLATSVLFASLSAGTFSPDDLWRSFANLLLQEVTFRLEDLGSDVPTSWPSRSEVNASPLEAIRNIVRTLTRQGHKLVVAIDEFTYIYENAPNEVAIFMRGWKALLEAKTFNAILVGQDTMPRFKQAFPNEFGVTHDERITYLNEEEASALATKPILLEGSSRYRGNAPRRLFDLTAGSPFFLQIACDRLVQHLNSRKAVFITEADIDQVARTLTVGSNALPPERFDSLVTAAGEKVAIIPRDNLWQVLARVARESLHSGWCYKRDIDGLPRSSDAVKDLLDREILAVEGERVCIRVGLFAAWLRANQ